MNYSEDGLIKCEKHGDVLINIIFANRFHRVAEIGVYHGETTKRILNNLTVNPLIKEYYCIDPWCIVPKEYGSWSAWPQKTWDEKYYKTCKVMTYFPAMKIIRMTSTSASLLFSRGFFDMVYIDGNHLYKAVVEDIESWLPLVRKGGILAGHDYLYRSGKGRRSKCEVLPAVDDTLGKTNIQAERDSVWVYQNE